MVPVQYQCSRNRTMAPRLDLIASFRQRIISAVLPTTIHSSVALSDSGFALCRLAAVKLQCRGRFFPLIYNKEILPSRTILNLEEVEEVEEVTKKGACGLIPQTNAAILLQITFIILIIIIVSILMIMMIMVMTMMMMMMMIILLLRDRVR